ncbi:hypothetical protein B0H11DRAFT_2375286 [Mycena galericulata]|nr:hypothetical protein B0H11DRAFT_2375286 [Mycena galericulata]
MGDGKGSCSVVGVRTREGLQSSVQQCKGDSQWYAREMDRVADPCDPRRLVPEAIAPSATVSLTDIAGMEFMSAPTSRRCGSKEETQMDGPSSWHPTRIRSELLLVFSGHRHVGLAPHSRRISLRGRPRVPPSSHSIHIELGSRIGTVTLPAAEPFLTRFLLLKRREIRDNFCPSTRTRIKRVCEQRDEEAALSTGTTKSADISLGIPTAHLITRGATLKHVIVIVDGFRRRPNTVGTREQGELELKTSLLARAQSPSEKNRDHQSRILSPVIKYYFAFNFPPPSNRPNNNNREVTPEKNSYGELTVTSYRINPRQEATGRGCFEPREGFTYLFA